MCAAGGGKTTRIVSEAAGGAERALLVTYTRNNEKEIERKLYGLGPVIPPHLEVMTWFSFLLRDLARPYRRVMYDHRIEGL
jgi:DNA helicase-2/ATP-dependent DNA helicase PcrA